MPVLSLIIMTLSAILVTGGIETDRSIGTCHRWHERLVAVCLHLAVAADFLLLLLLPPSLEELAANEVCDYHDPG